jgi:hypothetical protein
MQNIAPSRDRGAIDWLLRHPYTILATIIFIGQAVKAVAQHQTEWDSAYLAAASALAHHRDLFSVRGYRYPPFAAFLMIPFVYVPLRVARLIYFSVLAFCFIYYMKTAWRISGGKKIEGPNAAPRGEQLIFILGLACAGVFALNAMTHRQTDLIIAALLMTGLAEIARGRFLRSAVWIGLAAAFKATPLLFVPYLLWRRQWSAAVLLMIVFIGVNLLPDIVHRPDDGGVWLTHWTARYVQPMTQSDYDPGDWKNALNDNQGMAATVRRWFGTKLGDASVGYNAVSLPPDTPAVRRIFMAGAAIVLLPVLIVFWGKRKGYPPLAAPPDPRLIECSIVMLLMLVFSPNSSPAHFCIMLLPACCAARVALGGHDRLVRFLTAMAVICGVLSIHVRLPGSLQGEQFLLWLGIDLFAALFLMWACLAILARENPRLRGSSPRADKPEGLR